MADLEQFVQQLQSDLRQGRFPSEAAISQGAILPLLNNLGWPVFTTRIVWPQYPLEDRRVDYALCSPEEKPVIFIEVKAMGKIQGADKQLFEYAFHKGIPMAVLTDGQEWHIYLPAEQGTYEDRRVYKLDLLERTSQESAARLNRYLKYEAVRSGKAFQDARADYQDVNQKRNVEETIPKAWKQLLLEPDEILLELLIDKVEDLCGYKADPESCSKFIKQAALGISSPPTFDKPIILPPIIKVNASQGKIGYFLDGQFHNSRSAIETMVSILKGFAEKDPSFLDRFIARKHGRTRRYVARNKKELYSPERADLAETYSVEIMPGWFAGTNYNKQVIEKVIRLACEVAGVGFSNLKINLGD